jgi:hypothetical protein
MNKFIARRHNEDETITLIMTVSNKEKMHANEFLKSLKQAVNTFTTYHEEGKKMLEYSDGDFNFGDLAVVADSPLFLRIASKYRLFDLEIVLVQNNQDDFDFDTNLTK